MMPTLMVHYRNQFVTEMFDIMSLYIDFKSIWQYHSGKKYHLTAFYSKWVME